MSAGWKRDRHRLRRTVRKIEQRTSEPLLARIEDLEGELAVLYAAMPALSVWLWASFWRRCWNAARYVFLGDRALRTEE